MSAGLAVIVVLSGLTSASPASAAPTSPSVAGSCVAGIPHRAGLGFAPFSGLLSDVLPERATPVGLREGPPQHLWEAGYHWRWLAVGYVATVLMEAPVLLLLLSARHPWQRRLFAGVWLTACTYPAFVLALPVIVAPDPSPEGYRRVIIVGEVLVFAAEVLIFRLAFGGPGSGGDGWSWRDAGAVVAANAVSLGVGELLHQTGFFARLMGE